MAKDFKEVKEFKEAKEVKEFDGHIKDDEIVVQRVAEFGWLLADAIGVKDEVYNEEDFLPHTTNSNPDSNHDSNPSSTLRDGDYDHLSSYEIERLCKALGITVKTYQERVKRGLSKKEALTVKKHYNNNGNFKRYKSALPSVSKIHIKIYKK